MIDTHSHIFDEQFDVDRRQAVARAVEAGVERIILPAIDSSSHERMLDTAAKYQNVCVPAMGLHPTSINGNPAWRDELATVEKYFRELPAAFCAVGEVGLDLYWSRDSLDWQREALAAQVELAIRADLPLIIHTRDAWPEMLDLLAPYSGRVRGVFHSFSGTAREWEAVRRMDGFMTGIGGVVTYKKSGLKELLHDIPIEKILLETDSPYLAPTPHRGKRNESAYLPVIVGAVAEAKGLTIPEVDRITTDNARALFGL